MENRSLSWPAYVSYNRVDVDYPVQTVKYAYIAHCKLHGWVACKADGICIQCNPPKPEQNELGEVSL